MTKAMQPVRQFSKSPARKAQSRLHSVLRAEKPGQKPARGPAYATRCLPAAREMIGHEYLCLPITGPAATAPQAEATAYPDSRGRELGRIGRRPRLQNRWSPHPLGETASRNTRSSNGHRSPWLCAMAMASVREPTSSFLNRFRTWNFTVFSLMLSAEAMVRLR